MKFEPGGFARGTRRTRNPPTRVHTHVTSQNLDLKTGTYLKDKFVVGYSKEPSQQ